MKSKNQNLGDFKKKLSKKELIEKMAKQNIKGGKGEIIIISDLDML